MRRTTAALAACLLSAACAKEAAPKAQPSSGPPPSTAPSSAPPSASPSASPTPATITYGAPFYADDFKDKTKGWPERDTDTASYVVHTDYATPVYTITSKRGKYQLFPHPEFRGVSQEQLADYQVTAMIQTTLAVSREDWFGVTCRDLEGERYSFQVAYSTSGDDVMPWIIMKHTKAGGDDILARGEGEVGGSAFDVSGTCVGGAAGPATLVLSVNGKELGRATDAETPLTKGYGGVYLYSKDGKTTVNVHRFSARPATAS